MSIWNKPLEQVLVSNTYSEMASVRALQFWFVSNFTKRCRDWAEKTNVCWTHDDIHHSCDRTKPNFRSFTKIDLACRVNTSHVCLYVLRSMSTGPTMMTCAWVNEKQGPFHCSCKYLFIDMVMYSEEVVERQKGCQVCPNTPHVCVYFRLFTWLLRCVWVNEKQKPFRCSYKCLWIDLIL